MSSAVDLASRNRLALDATARRWSSITNRDRKDANNPNGTTATYGHDNAGRLTDIAHTNGSTEIDSWSYALDQVGNVLDVAVGGAGSSYSEVVLGDTPVGYWRLGETSGTTALDEVAGNDGTYVNSPTLGATGLLTGDTNKAITLAHASEQYVEIPHSADYKIATTGVLTVEFLGKLGYSAAGRGKVVSKSSGNGEYEWAIAAYDADAIRVNVWEGSGGGVATSTFSVPGGTTDVNAHWAFVMDETNDLIIMYMNGLEFARDTTTWTGASDGSASSAPVQIGRRGDDLDYLTGTVDEVAIYDYAMTAGQVEAHFAAATSGGGTVESTYGYDRLYRLTNATEPVVGSTTYSYDPAGNRQSRVRGSTTSYTYDRADRILSLQGPPAPGSSVRPPASHNSGWTNSANAYAANEPTNTYATTAPNKNQTKTVDYGTFGFDSTIPANATITAVTVSLEWKVSTTASIATLGAQARVNGAAAGSELVNTAEPTTDTTQTFSVPGLTRAQLLDGAFTVRVRATRGNSNTAFTASLDVVSVAVDYTVPGTVTLTSNAIGNLVAKGADTFAYDQANRLVSATVAGATETYTYDGDGVRFSRTVGAGPAIRSVSDVNTSLPLTLDDGTRKYVWGLGLAYAVSGSSLEVYHTDRLGSVRAITDASGAVTESYRTDEFGVPTASTGSSAQPFTFTGEPRDATGLSYLRARYYDPTLGRFMSRDTWAGIRSSPGSLNRFVYVDANPASRTDPSGRVGPAVACIVALPVCVEAVGFGLTLAGAAAATAAGWVLGGIIFDSSPTTTNPMIEEIRGDPTWRPWTPPEPNPDLGRAIQELYDFLEPNVHLGLPGGMRLPPGCRNSPVCRTALKTALIGLGGLAGYFLIKFGGPERLEEKVWEPTEESGGEEGPKSEVLR